MLLLRFVLGSLNGGIMDYGFYEDPFRKKREKINIEGIYTCIPGIYIYIPVYKYKYKYIYAHIYINSHNIKCHVSFYRYVCIIFCF